MLKDEDDEVLPPASELRRLLKFTLHDVFSGLDAAMTARMHREEAKGGLPSSSEFHIQGLEISCDAHMATSANTEKMLYQTTCTASSVFVQEPSGPRAGNRWNVQDFQFKLPDHIRDSARKAFGGGDDWMPLPDFRFDLLAGDEDDAEDQVNCRSSAAEETDA